MKRVVLFLGITCCLVLAFSAVQLMAQGAAAAKEWKGLQVTVSSVEYTASIGLTDCPPGANTDRGMGRGDEFAVVTVDMKVLPSFKPGPIAKPTSTDAAGKVYNTAVSFVDVGKVPEFTCKFPFRVPTGTKLKKFQLETLSFDLSNVGPPPPSSH